MWARLFWIAGFGSTAPEIGDLLAAIAGLFAQLALGGDARMLVGIDHATWHFERDLRGAEAKLTDHDQVAERIEGHDVHPIGRVDHGVTVLNARARRHEALEKHLVDAGFSEQLTTA